MSNMNIIYDFETLGTEPTESAAVSLAILEFSDDRMQNKPYTFQELLDATKQVKFDVTEQVKKYGRTIDPGTLEWWGKLPAKTQKQLKPSDSDISISRLHDWISENTPVKNINRVFTRGNAFDPPFMTSLCNTTGFEDPFPFWKVRDTRTFIEAIAYGTKINDKFIPEGLEEIFEAHDPAHDIVMDVMRMQTLIQAIQ